MRIKPMLMGALALGCACALSGETKEVGVKGGAPGVAVQKLQTCDFLLNKDFKKNAKYYLCLFSASWCGPCRREMPRIAKTYAESLKADPNVELIHFSCDREENKALAWAKEHDVKFPVVKYNGGNPLDLHTRGIPHLFIVKADGTLVEEGHPMRLFTDEKLRELKTANSNVEAKGKTKMVSSGKETIDGVEWTYRIIDGQAQLDYASSSNVTGSITIPSTLGGCPVTSIRGRQYGQRGVFEQCCKLTSVTIPSSVTNIGDRAFESCRELRSVTIQSSATRIGGFAFFGCNSLVSLVIPSGVTSIGYRAFAHCRGLTSVTISSSVKRIERGGFLSCDNLMSISVEPDNPSYSSRNGLLCSKDGSILVAGVNGDVTIPSSVTRIGNGAFDGYGGLTSVTIPSSVTRIGERAFAICSGLMSVTIPSSVTSIGGDAFNGTPFYNNLPDGMVVLGGGVLCGYKGKCPSAVVIPSNVWNIADSAFSEGGLRGLRIRRRGAGLGLKKVVISSSVTNIGNRAFSYCGDLVEVTMRGERPKAPNNIFQGCGKLKSIQVPANAKSWAGMKKWQGIPLAFDKAEQERSAEERAQQREQLLQIQEELRKQRRLEAEGKVELPYEVVDGAVVLGSKGSPSLLNRKKKGNIVAEIPSGALVIPDVIDGFPVGVIGYNAFFYCKKVTSVTIPSSVTNIVSGAFSGCNEIMSFSVDVANPSYSSRDGLLYSKNGTTLVAGINGEVTIPSSVTSIGDCAFSGCSGLTSFFVAVDNANYSSVNGLLLTKDGKTLIQGVNGNVTIPDSVMSIGTNAFKDCDRLKRVTIPDSVTNIGDSAFYGCNRFGGRLRRRGGGLKMVVISSSVTNIGDRAFSYCCDLVAVTMRGERPDAPKNIFERCDKLKSIHVPANAKSWAGMKEWHGIPLVFDAK